ncbi:MAG: hypothetical protein CVV06_09400 [Gammaproteobacteria bacterium HGW-Gammaproteobacteria-10]|nr:MAG: hypothetical protein CVV06_09400 [Gammaproteobacteria bacterium HGW-Gammaproteobacteria-10]
MAVTDTPDNEKIPLYKPNQLPHRKKRSAKKAKAQRVLNKYTLIASGIGFIPGPLAGQIAVGGLLAKLMDDLCKIYGLSFSDHQIKITVTAILGGAHYDWISHYLIKYVKGYIPISASTGSLLLRPAVSGLLVYYIGKLFLLHLESGAWVRVKEKGFNP